ncbi:hypothetical protein J6590_004907 [Homalodisca vitripennis]|nr:hypothetical protein J6590_038242 [Homalodisca vitripennis]KAG8259780.1 hypothetical protein J6590_004907 [Homalodisca vitripennis]
MLRYRATRSTSSSGSTLFQPLQCFTPLPQPMIDSRGRPGPRPHARTGASVHEGSGPRPRPLDL